MKEEDKKNNDKENFTPPPKIDAQEGILEVESEEIQNQVTINPAELAQLKKDLAEYKDKYLRLLADADNLRKRMQKERIEMVQYSIGNVVLDFLNPIDHFENALMYTNQMSDEVKHWAVGFQMILSQFKDALANNGIVTFKSEGTQFDPNCHEAIENVETNDYPPNTVITETLRGYKMGDRTIRPARVKVSKKTVVPVKEESIEKENKSENKS